MSTETMGQLPELVEVEYSWFERGRRNGYYPRCKNHGPMRYRENLRRWGCAGFDGEGCPARITDEQMNAYLRPDAHSPVRTSP